MKWKISHILFLFFPVCLLARDGLSIGLNGGFEADTFKYGQKYAQIAIGNALIVGAANFWNSLDSSVTIEKVYVDTQQDVTINGVYGIATFENYPMILQNNVGEFKYIRPEHNSQAMVSIPVGGNMRYSWKFLLFRVGFTYDFIMSNTFKPVVNSFIWNDNATSFPAQAGGLLSGQNVFDMVLQNAADSGVAILPSTGGRDITIRQEITAQRVDAPVSIALQFINTYALKAYIGGGITYFWGKTTRVLQDTLPNTIADIDVYEGSTLGFHLLTGIEYEVLNRLGVSAELFFNYGIAGPLTDQVITEDPYTVRSFFHNPKTDRLGAEDRNNPEVSQLEFTGVRILLGVNYYVLQ